MTQTSKTVLATLALSLALVGCDNIVKNNNEGQSPVVEENTADPNASTEESQEQENVDQTTQAETSDSEQEAGAGEEATNQSEVTEVTDEPSADKDLRTTLEEAIFENRAQARAIELLLEMAPAKVADIEPQLNEMLGQSNDLIAEAQAILSEIDQ